MPLMRLELLPGPTKYFILCSYSYTGSTIKLLEKPILHMKSRQQYSSKGGLNLLGLRVKRLSGFCLPGVSTMMDFSLGRGDCVFYYISGLLKTKRLLWLQFLSMRILCASRDYSISLMEIFSTERQSLILLDSFGRTATARSCIFLFLLFLRRNCVWSGPRERLTSSETVFTSNWAVLTLGRLHFCSIWTKSMVLSDGARSMEAQRWKSVCLPMDLTSSSCCIVNFQMWRYMQSNFSFITIQPIAQGIPPCPLWIPWLPHPLSSFLRGRQEKDFRAQRCMADICFSLSLLSTQDLSAIRGIKLQAAASPLNPIKHLSSGSSLYQNRRMRVAGHLKGKLGFFQAESRIIFDGHMVEVFNQIFSPQMKLLIIILLCFCLQAQNQRNYSQILSLWQNAAGKKATFSLKQFASQKEICGNVPCEPFYFLAENKELMSQQQTNLTVLLVGGLRGDDAAGPSILLNAYGHINAARTIFFPFANPSGVSNNSALTVPGGVNPQKDFPLGDNQKCFESAATKSLLYLYRKYSIDLAIYLHDGKPSIAYSWGISHQDTFQAQDFGIYADIADMVRFEGNSDKELNAIEAGSAYELQPAVTAGGFLDWAYGASKYPQIFSKRCTENTKSIGEAKHNGLVVSLGVGKIPTGEQSLSLSEKHFNRALLLLQKITSITAPKVQLTVNSKDITVTLHGCKTGTASNIKITKQTGETLFKRQGDAILKGDMTNGPAEPKIFPHKLNVLPNTIIYQITFQCDNGWVNIGKTAFSKSRIFTQTGTVASTQLPPSQQPKLSTQVKVQNNQGTTWRTYEIIGGILFILAAVWIIVGMRLGLKVQQQQRIKNFNQKFETVQVVQDLEAYSNSIDEKQSAETTEALQAKEVDHDNQRLNAS